MAIAPVGGERDGVGGIGARAVDREAAREVRAHRVVVGDAHLAPVVGDEVRARHREVGAGHPARAVDAVLPARERRELAADRVAVVAGGAGIRGREPELGVGPNGLDRVVRRGRAGRKRLVADADHVASAPVDRPPRGAHAGHDLRAVGRVHGARGVVGGGADRAVVRGDRDQVRAELRRVRERRADSPVGAQRRGGGDPVARRAGDAGREGPRSPAAVGDVLEAGEHLALAVARRSTPDGFLKNSTRYDPAGTSSEKLTTSDVPTTETLPITGKLSWLFGPRVGVQGVVGRDAVAVHVDPQASVAVDAIAKHRVARRSGIGGDSLGQAA